jgi:hypothetical protein
MVHGTVDDDVTVLGNVRRTGEYRLVVHVIS